MVQDILVVNASAHSYNLGEDNYAAGRYSQAVVDGDRACAHGDARYCGGYVYL
jgi:hypothetical protein